MSVSSSLLLRIGGKRSYQYIAAFTVNLGIVCSEMHYGWPSPFSPVLLDGSYKFTISKEEDSWLTVIPLIGAIIGACFTGLVVDIVGRKKLIICSSIPFVLSWVLIGVARSSVLMFVGRFIAGVSDGLSFTAVPMYLGEIAEPKIRGLLASFCPVCIVVGILMVNILGAFLRLDTAAYIASAVPVLLLITFSGMPESPYFYLIKGMEEDAKKSLQFLRGTDDVSMELMRISKAVREQNENKASFLDLFRIRSNRRGMIITLGLRSVQQLTGTTVIMFYCQTIFRESGGSLSPSISTIIYFSVQLVFAAISSVVVDFSGRKPLLIVSIVGTTFALLVNATYLYLSETGFDTSSYNFVPIIALLGFVVTFSIGLQNIPLLMMGEIFPTDVKAFALCTMDIYYSVIVTFISKLFHWMKDRGMHLPFFTFAGCCVFGLVFIVFCVPETKGKTLEEIQEELQGKKRVVDRKPEEEHGVY